MTRGDAFDRRPRHQRRRQRRLRTCAAVVVAALVGASRRRGRRAAPRDRADHRAGGRAARLGLRSVRLARPAGRRRPDAVQERREVPRQCARRAQAKDRALRDQGAPRLAAGPIIDSHAEAAQVHQEARGEVDQGRGKRGPQGRGAAAPGRPGRGGRGRDAEPAEALASAYAELNRDEGPRRPAVRRRVRARPEVRPGLRARSVVFGADAGAVRGRRGVPARRGGPRVARGGRPRAAGAEQLRADHDPLGAAGLDIDGYATLETLLPTYFRGLRQAAPPRPPFQRKDRSQGAAARALRRLCDADQQIFDAAALIYQRRAKECEAAAREYEHAVELRHARLALNRRRERRGPAEAATSGTRPRSGGGPNDRRGRPPSAP